jgi:hypothetical protein
MSGEQESAWTTQARRMMIGFGVDHPSALCRRSYNVSVLSQSNMIPGLMPI